MSVVVLVALAVVTVACGGSNASPTSPTQQSAQVGGIWSLTATSTSITGGECVGALLQAAIGKQEVSTLTITQTGSSLAVIQASNSTGLTCRYSGTVSGSTMALTFMSCDAGVFAGIRCSNGAVRDLRLLADSLTATVNGTSITGTGAASYNVTNSQNGAGVGAMVSNYRFTGAKR